MFVTSESVQRKRLEIAAELVVVILSNDQGAGQSVIPRLREIFTGHVIAVGKSPIRSSSCVRSNWGRTCSWT